jgi:hypothetical protein
MSTLNQDLTLFFLGFAFGFVVAFVAFLWLLWMV